MRISDWSSDVCASVLLASGGAGEVRSGADRRAADVLPGLYHGLLSQRVRAVPAALADPASARHALRLGGARHAVAPAAADPPPGLPRQLAGHIGADVPAGLARYQRAHPGAALHPADPHPPLYALTDPLQVPFHPVF